MALIRGFESIDEAKLINLAGDGNDIGSLPNTDVYRKPIPGDVINVVKNFSWFSGGASTDAAIERIPTVLLIEKEQVLNSQLSQAIYFLNATLNASADIGTALSKFSEYIGIDGDTAGSIKDVVARGFNKIKSKVKKISSSGSDSDVLTSNYLRSLIGLYVTEDTGFKYSLPYFDNPPVVTNNWGSPSSHQGVANQIINAGMQIVEEVSAIANIAQPGVYIQKSKHFMFADQGPSITVKFPLFNTVKRGNELPYQLNYELLWLLTYQNKPYKTSFARSIPPKIYNATIPGMVNMPFAYISNLTVDFIGTVRNKEVSIADIGTITVPIPDAYDVTIQITSLLSDYANLMIGTGFGVNINHVKNKVTLSNTNPTIPPRPASSSIPGVSLAGPALDADAPENNPLTAPGGDIQGIRDPIVGQGGSADDGSRVFTGREAIKQAQSLGINPGGYSGAGPTSITSVTVPPGEGPIGVLRDRILDPSASTISGVTPPVNNQNIVPGGEVDGSLLGSILNSPQ